jgi:hypothetical protein
VKITIEPTTDQGDVDLEGRYPEVSACWRDRDDLDAEEFLELVKTAMEAYGFTIPGLKVTDE